jgi:hypothetical protein
MKLNTLTDRLNKDLKIKSCFLKRINQNNKKPPSLDELLNNEKVEVKRKKEIPPKEA